MSWSASGLISEQAYYQENFSNIDPPEHLKQFEAGLRAALAIVKSGALGDPSNDYKVNLNGHANPEHKQTPGWSDDFVNVSVHQVN